MMKQWASILWKEWHEARVFLFIGLFVFLGLPLIGGLEQKIHGPFFEVLAGPWVFCLGGVFAVFVGVGIGGRDLRGQLEDFWRSRPMNVPPWMLIKWAVGLVIVLVCLIVPLAVQAIVTPSLDTPEPAGVLLAWNPFLWAALYSIAFLVASLVRQGAHSTLLALSLLLLAYFLPFVLPPLQRAGIFWVMGESANPRQTSSGKLLRDYHQVPWVPWHVLYERQQLSFIAAMIVLSAAALVVAIVAVRRGWRVESGRRTLYWSVGASLLILFSSAAFQLAANLPVLQQVAIPGNEHVSRIISDGSGGVMFTRGFTTDSPVRPMECAYPLRIAGRGVELGKPVRFDSGVWDTGARTSIWLPRHPDIVYCLHYPPVPEGQPQLAELLRIRLDVPDSNDAVQTIYSSTQSGAMLYEAQDRLYMTGPKLVVFDLTDPMRPKVASTAEARWGDYHGPSSQEGPVIAVNLLQAPGVSPREALQMRMADLSVWSLDGDTLTMAYGGPLATYRLTELTPQFARFDQAGTYSASLLEQVFGQSRSVCRAENGLVYESSPASSSLLRGARLTVFDVRNPARPTPVAHFAAPDASSQLVVCPLPDGRALIGGVRLYLVGPPPGSGEVSGRPRRSN